MRFLLEVAALVPSSLYPPVVPLSAGFWLCCRIWLVIGWARGSTRAHGCRAVRRYGTRSDGIVMVEVLQNAFCEMD